MNRFPIGIGILLAVLLIFTAPAAAENSVYFEPDPSSAAPGETITVTMWVNTSDGTAGFQDDLYFDPTVVNITEITPGYYDSYWMVIPYYEQNFIRFGGDSPDFHDHTGLRILANITLEAIGSGTCALDHKEFPIAKLYDEYGNSVPDQVWYDGTFNCPCTVTEVDNETTADIPVSGAMSGNHTLTHESDNVYEFITEVQSTGRPAKNQYSYLEHKWTIDVIDGSKTNITFYLEAHHSLSSDGDDFVFAYSTDDNTYTDMATVTKTSDDNTYQTYELPNDLSGTVYIRVKDTDQTAGNQDLNAVYIDQMFIRSVLAPPGYGVTVTIDESSQTVAPGNSTTYTVRVKNTGDLDASYSVVMSGTAVDESTIDVSPLNWNTGTLSPNAETVQTVTVSTTASTSEMTYTLTATATCDQDASVTDSATSDLVVSSATNAMHIASIDMSLKTAGPNKNAVAMVKIVDADGVPVAGATVEGHWSGATTDADSGLTGASGEVALDSDKLRNPPSGTVFTFTVDDVSLAGWIYNQAANAETSDSITVA